METVPLRNLARLYGVSATYVDVWGQRRQASQEAVLRILQLYGAPVASLADVPDALRERRQELWREMIEPVVVAFDAAPATAHVRLPEGPRQAAFRYRVQLEDGGTVVGNGTIDELPVTGRRVVERVEYTRRALHLPSDLPAGYHRLHWECQAYLAASEAGIVLVNLEDLWGKIEPQNRPGTYREYPNWQRPARLAIDEFRLRADVRRILETVHHRRQSGSGKRGREEGERC